MAFQQNEISQLSTEIVSMQRYLNNTGSWNHLLDESKKLTKTISVVRTNLTRGSKLLSDLNITNFPQAQMKFLQDEIDQAQESSTVAYNYTNSVVNVIAMAFTVFSIIIAIHHVRRHEKKVKAMAHEMQERLDDEETLDSAENKELIKAYKIFAETNVNYLPVILLLPALCALVNWIMLSFNGNWFNRDYLSSVEAIEECLTAVAVYSFFKLMTNTMVRQTRGN